MCLCSDTFDPFDPNSCEYVLSCLYKDVKIQMLMYGENHHNIVISLQLKLIN